MAFVCFLVCRINEGSSALCTSPSRDFGALSRLSTSICFWLSEKMDMQAEAGGALLTLFSNLRLEQLFTSTEMSPCSCGSTQTKQDI